MTVGQLMEFCYDKVVIYSQRDEDFIEWDDLYVGYPDGIPKDLLNLEIHCFGGYAERTVDIWVKKQALD